MESKSSKESRESSASRTEIRRWVRTEEPLEGWWPWGIVPLLLLGLVALIAFFYVAPSKVEAQTQTQAEKQLRAAGMPWAKVETSGQIIRVSGTVPGTITPELRAQVESAATVGNCELFGCDVEVSLKEGAPVIEPATPPPAAVAERFHNFAFESSGKAIVLKGEVASEAVRGELVGAARKHFDEVDDQLTISAENATAGYPLAFSRAFPILGMLENGKATWTDGQFDVVGLVSEANDGPAKAAFAAADASPKLGAINLIVKEAADRCDEEFAAAFAKSTINFRTSSAVIAPTSRKLLARLAKTAKACPGSIAIEGHTDGDGKEESNMTLSRARAEAVAKALGALGIDASRLSPKGFGESRPIAPNNTVAGKAKNRRIEIRVIR